MSEEAIKSLADYYTQNPFKDSGFGALLDGMYQEYEHLVTSNRIVLWSSIPFSIKKKIVLSIKHRVRGKQGLMTLLYGDVMWTIRDLTNTEYETEIDKYMLQRCPAADYVLIMFKDKMYDELIEDLKHEH